jgi:ParB family transcriptional regulator, chromosome partitioning protein
MALESRGLGRGLGALLGAQPTVSASRGAGTLPVSLMRPGASQPRKTIHPQPLEELAASIKANGVIQPIVVRSLPAGSSQDGVRYEIVAGERRWQAAKLAGLADIPVVVRELSDAQAVAVALIENIQREELTPAEEARALMRLIGEFSLTHSQVAEAVGRSRAAVTNLLRLLDLPADVVALVDSKALSMGHARALLGLEEDAERAQLAKLVAERGYSVRETENLVRRAQKSGPESVRRPASHLAVVSEVLRTPEVRVELHQRASGGARIVVDVTDPGARDSIIEAIRDAVRDSNSRARHE